MGSSVIVPTCDSSKCLVELTLLAGRILVYLALILRVEVEKAFEREHLLSHTFDIVQLVASYDQLHACVLFLEHLDPLGHFRILTLHIKTLRINPYHTRSRNQILDSSAFHVSDTRIHACAHTSYQWGRSRYSLPYSQVGFLLDWSRQPGAVSTSAKSAVQTNTFESRSSLHLIDPPVPLYGL